MKIIGYCVHGSKQFVAFTENEGEPEKFKVTDGFHDKVVNKRNKEKYDSYTWVGKEDIDLDKIICRLRGARPWHPLLTALKKKMAG